MAELSNIAVYPLTGGRGQERDHWSVGPSGLAGDRSFVLYDPETHDRLSQRQLPQLARLSARIGLNALTIYDEVDRSIISQTDAPYEHRVDKLTVNEFGDQEPCFGVRPGMDEALSEYFGRLVGLAQKQVDWRYHAHYGQRVKPALRKNAPLHIINRASVNALEVPGIEEQTLAGRFRANLIVDGFEPFSEAEWAGKSLKIGQLVVPITRLAGRCPVPGYDQATGENMKDVPKIYRSLPKAENGKPSFGVYGYPIIPAGELMTEISVGQKVELLS